MSKPTMSQCWPPPNRASNRPTVDQREKWLDLAAEQTPLRRVGAPDDVAGTIAFLSSDDVSYVSNAVHLRDK